MEHLENENENKTTVWIIQVTKRITLEMIWAWLKRGNLKIEIQFLFIAAQNNVIRTNYVLAKIKTTQKNGNCR